MSEKVTEEVEEIFNQVMERIDKIDTFRLVAGVETLFLKNPEKYIDLTVWERIKEYCKK